jgi:hypothetical protein
MACMANVRKMTVTRQPVENAQSHLRSRVPGVGFLCTGPFPLRHNTQCVLKTVGEL